jgi:hypothetical protein
MQSIKVIVLVSAAVSFLLVALARAQHRIPHPLRPLHPYYGAVVNADGGRDVYNRAPVKHEARVHHHAGHTRAHFGQP